MMNKKYLIIFSSILIVIVCLLGVFNKTSLLSSPSFGEPVDSLNGVLVYYNGDIDNVEGRNTVDGYNLGLKYQCVEFVKRYYYYHLEHKMPDSYGHAKSFFIEGVKDGEINKQRNLVQYTNPSKSKPKLDDLIVMGESKYGHVAIVSAVSDSEVELTQQNPGVYGDSRIRIAISQSLEGKWLIERSRVLGWLRKE